MMLVEKSAFTEELVLSREVPGTKYEQIKEKSFLFAPGQESLLKVGGGCTCND